MCRGMIPGSFPVGLLSSQGLSLIFLPLTGALGGDDRTSSY